MEQSAGNSSTTFEEKVRWFEWRPKLSVEGLAFSASLFFMATSNVPFLRGILANRNWENADTWKLAFAMLVMLVALHMLLMCLVLTRWIAKPLLSLLVFTTALASFYMQSFGTYMDPTMLRNVLRTDVKEASELVGWGLVTHLLIYGALPILFIWRVRLTKPTLRHSLIRRSVILTLSAMGVLGALLLVFQDFSALMRNQKELRYLITPANYLYSTGRVLAADTRMANRVRSTVGVDAHLAPLWKDREKPALVVIVVGETLRAANLGLNGYIRQTTPKLAAMDVFNFPVVSACGTNTETSLPCMFSAIGRRDYDEARIRGSESLLHVLKRAGLNVLWRDNQSGCKGVCDGLPEESIDPAMFPKLCADGRCYDEALLAGMHKVIQDANGNLVVVLHMLGNHGPSYYKRYPAEFELFVPACVTAELHKCDRQSIVNAYDNAVLYTDHVLSHTIELLKGTSKNPSADATPANATITA